MTDDIQDSGETAALPPPPVPLEQRLDLKRLVAVGITIGLAFGGLVWLYLTLSTATSGPAKDLGTIVLLLAGLAVVTLILYLGTLIVRALDLANPAEALGMPTGSVRALIAVALILLFAIVGFVVFQAATGSSREPVVSHGLTQLQIDKFRLDGAVVLNQDLTNPGASPGLELYNATIQPGLPADAHDFGLQLLSTTITLVVAVAGFYFGAQTVAQAGKETRNQLGLIQDARAARRAEIIGAVPDPPATVPEDMGDEPPVADADDISTEATDGRTDETTDETTDGTTNGTTNEDPEAEG